MEILFIIALFAYSFIYLLIKNAEVLGLVDIPNDRSSHKRIMPRSAGIGFVSASLLGLTIGDFTHVVDYYYIYVSILLIMLVGVYDDRFEVSYRIKFIGLLSISAYVVFNGISVDSLGNYFGYDVSLPFFLAFPFSIFAIIGFTNALNLTDGLDGLAGSLSLIMLTVFLIIGYQNNDTLMINLSSAFIVSLVVFLYFNWYPAKIFMGDSGSLTLGFVISILSIKALNYIPPSAVLFIIGIPLVDTFIVMRRRIQRGQSPFKADKNHIHHFMYKVKLDVNISVLLILYLQIALSLLGYQLISAKEDFFSLVLFVLLLFIFLNMFDQRFRHRKNKSYSKGDKS
jgi:UDP-GlcNAc:undecaprenyl-phosphate GlcNAc-1-phosphate transferase